MRVDYVPLLQTQREVYKVPRGWDRFRQYLEIMQPGTDDQIVPMFVMNPMAKEHVTARLDELLALDADGIAGRAAAGAARRLAHLAGQYKAGIVLADDVQGGWTNRYLSDAQLRFGYTLRPRQRAKANAAGAGGWIVGLLWASEEPTPRHIDATIQAAVYRAAYVQHHGLPTTLRQMLVQESLALAFADARPASLDKEESEYARHVIRPYLDSTDFPVAFACIYGDSAAHAVGYPQFGLPDGAGLTVAYQRIQADLQRSGQTAEAAILDDTIVAI
jgi:hypothetical protein